MRAGAKAASWARKPGVAPVRGGSTSTQVASAGSSIPANTVSAEAARKRALAMWLAAALCRAQSTAVGETSTPTTCWKRWASASANRPEPQ